MLTEDVNARAQRAVSRSAANPQHKHALTPCGYPDACYFQVAADALGCISRRKTVRNCPLDRTNISWFQIQRLRMQKPYSHAAHFVMSKQRNVVSAICRNLGLMPLSSDGFVPGFRRGSAYCESPGEGLRGALGAGRFCGAGRPGCGAGFACGARFGCVCGRGCAPWVGCAGRPFVGCPGLAGRAGAVADGVAGLGVVGATPGCPGFAGRDGRAAGGVAGLGVPGAVPAAPGYPGRAG